MSNDGCSPPPPPPDPECECVSWLSDSRALLIPSCTDRAVSDLRSPLNRRTSRPSRLLRLRSVGANDALLDEIANEPVLEVVLPSVLASLGESKEFVVAEPGSELLPNRPRNVLRDLLSRRGICDESGSGGRWMAEVD